MKSKNLKDQVKKYWNNAACGTEFINQTKFTPAYFHAIEDFRYTVEPEIFSFAQFTRFHGKKVLEIGVGASTDFLQWARAGAMCHGIDLTEEAIAHATQRLALENLHAIDLRVADAEKLPYPDNYFDLVYSWGVIHHSPNTQQCLEEIIRVTSPGGIIKIMIYNRHSLFAFYCYLRHALFGGKPLRSVKNVLYWNQESVGTKAYTTREAKKMLQTLPVSILQIKSPATKHDLLYYKSKPIQWAAYLLASLCGWNRCGWFMLIELKKL